jgi:hypothetical protein
MNKYSFVEILTKEVEINNSKIIFDGIQVPIIQRDYAQGRKKESSIRDRFLKSIFKALKKNKNLELDFVYGSKKSVDTNKLFIPLDGQQRLTTLYLLNWYIGNRELEEKELADLRAILSKFTYATRFSSNKFCEKLASEKISFTKNPSEEIMDSSWFFDTFKLDPTVQSMLVMLDAIHQIYEKTNLKLYAQLNHIKFYFLPLDGFDLTDELYIKMNARGKQLTNFENFKADLIKWIQNKKNPYKKEFKEIRQYNDLEVEYNLHFELKIDIDWTGLFWNHTKKNTNNEDKLVDPYMMQFFNRTLLNTYIISSKLSQSEIETDSKFKALYGKQGDDSKIVYNEFDYYSKILKKDSINGNRIFLIEKVFNALTEYWTEINNLISPSWNKNDNWNLFSKSINQRQRIILFATTIYLEKFTFDSEKFADWIRFVWNIIIDPNLRSVPAMVAAMRFVNEVSIHSNDILDYLKNPNSILFPPTNSSYLTQLTEEHKKAILIKQSEEWKNQIIDAESHKLFQGNIMFLLDDEFIVDLETFKLFKKISFEIFEDNDLTDKEPENYLWIRALLTKSSNIDFPIVLTNGNFYHWRYLINSSFIIAFRLLIKEIANSTLSTEESMKSICDNYLLDLSKEWLFPLVNWVGKNGETLLGNYSETRKIQMYNNYGNTPNYIYLYNKTVWTEGNIILSTNRNKVISVLLNKHSDIKINSDWSNIQNSFFRGWHISFKRKVNSLPFTYMFDHEYLTIGMKYTLELGLQFPDYQINDSNWFFKRRYKYIELKEENLESFIELIDEEIFASDNSKSEINNFIKK